MKRLGRWLLNFTAGISFVVCTMSAVMWVRSYFACDAFSLIRTGTEWVNEVVVISPTGVINLGRRTWRSTLSSTILSQSPATIQSRHFQHDVYAPSADTNLFGVYKDASFRLGRFMYFHVAADREHSFDSIRVPYWVVVLLSGMFPSIKVARMRWVKTRKDRQLHACCITCGYDLRATPEKCPECGTIV